MKRVFSLILGVALVFSACNKEAEEGGLKSGAQDVPKAVDVKNILATHGDCIADFHDAGYNQAWFNSFGKKLNGSGKHVVAENIYFEKHGNDTRLYFLEGAKGIVTVAYKNGNYFAFFNFTASCLAGNAIFFDGKIYSNLAWEYEEEKDTTIPEVNIGLIGWYPHSGTVMQTSFYWINLKPGQCIDWEEVDAAYAEWMAKGGLKPARPTWVTSGFNSFAFNEEDGLCFEDITLGQLEAYYRAYYIDPGYVVCDGDKCDECGLGCECGEFGCSNGPCECAPVTPPVVCEDGYVKNAQGNCVLDVWNPNRPPVEARRCQNRQGSGMFCNCCAATNGYEWRNGQWRSCEGNNCNSNN